MGILLGDRDKTLAKIDASLELLEVAEEIVSAPVRPSVLNLRAMGAKQNALVATDGDILRRAAQILKKYASVEYKRQRLEVNFYDQENAKLKAVFLELLAEKTNAECIKSGNGFSLSFRSAEQMSLWGS